MSLERLFHVTLSLVICPGRGIIYHVPAFFYVAAFGRVSELLKHEAPVNICAPDVTMPHPCTHERYMHTVELKASFLLSISPIVCDCLWIFTSAVLDHNGTLPA